MYRSLVPWTRAVLFALVCLIPSATFAAENEIRLAIKAGEHDRTNVPVSVLVEVPEGWGKVSTTGFESEEGAHFDAQVSAPALLSNQREAKPGHIWRQLSLVVPELKAGTTLKLKPGPSSAAVALDEFKPQWNDTPGEYSELRRGEHPVLRYMYTPLDESSKENREKTYKVYHHLYSPDGSRIVTKGPGGQFTHHRGLFYGFNRISYGKGKSADTWHCRGKAFLSHDGFLASDTGPVFGRHCVQVGWHGQEGELFAEEERELTAYRMPQGQLIEFASRLKSTGGKIHLDGDPQHAGFQFRADNEVSAQTKSQTYYVRTDGKGKPGETRNWSKNNPECENRPWNAMSFVLGDVRYTAVYLDRPKNPKPARYSERDYGRFGSYFVYDLDDDNSLDVNYRIWLQEGEMTVEELAALSANFVDPPQVVVE